MHITADKDRCVGAGQCVLTAPAVFDQDDDGIVEPLTLEPPVSAQDAVRQAVNVCPSSAIWLDKE
jgi:ferredoxin